MLENDERGGKRGFVKFSARNRRRPKWIRATTAARVQEAPPHTLDLSKGRFVW
jgi:ribosomal protein L39E